jgi:hypothetical protein
MGLSNTGMTTLMGVSPAIGGVLADQIGPHAAVGTFGVVGLVLLTPLAASWYRTIKADPERWIPSDTTPTNNA